MVKYKRIVIFKNRLVNRRAGRMEENSLFEFGLKIFDARAAERNIRSAFYEVKELLDVTEEDIDFFVNEEMIREFQERRLSKFSELKKLKADLQMRFRDYRVEGRIKSLTSLLGKYMKGRKLLDTFGL